MIAFHAVLVVALVGLVSSVRILEQYDGGVHFRVGRVKDGARGRGVILIIPLVDRAHHAR